MFVTANQERKTQGLRWGFEPICKVLQVAPSNFRSHLTRPVCERKITYEIISAQIKRVHAQNYSVYGIRKIRAA